MEEENKVVEAEVAEAPKEEPKQEEGGMTPNCKTALIAFILSVAAFVVGVVWWIGAIGGIVCGILALVFLKKINGEVEKQPFRTFSKIALPLGIVSIVWSAGWLIYYLVVFIIWIVAIVVGATAEAASQVAVLF